MSKKMEVIITKDTVADKKRVKKGKKLTLPEKEAKQLILMGKAEESGKSQDQRKEPGKSGK